IETLRTSDWNNPMALKRLQNFRNVAFLLFALGVMLVACPGARAQVPTPQTGASGQSAPPPTPDAAAKPKPAPKPKAKPADRTAAAKKKAAQKKQTIDVNTTA